MSLCEHNYCVEQDGFQTCFNCGLVIDTLTFEINNTPISIESKHRELENDISILLEMHERDMISKNVVDFAIKTIREWNKDNIGIKKYSLPFALYYATRTLNYPLTLFEICDFFQVSLKKISKMEKIFNFSKTLSGKVYAEKFCRLLDIKYQTIKVIKDQCKYFENILNLQPLTILSALIKINSEKKIHEIYLVTRVHKKSILRAVKLIMNRMNDYLEQIK